MVNVPEHAREVKMRWSWLFLQSMGALSWASSLEPGTKQTDLVATLSQLLVANAHNQECFLSVVVEHARLLIGNIRTLPRKLN